MKVIKWLISRLNVNQVVDLVFSLLFKLFGEIGEFIAEQVGQAEQQFPEPGSGKLKWQWVWERAVQRYPLLKNRKALVNWLIEWAVAQLNDGAIVRNALQVLRSVK